MIGAAVNTLLFYLLALIAVGMAVAVVTTRRLLRAGVFLMSMLAVSAGLYLMLHAEFLAGVQVLVYIGGIMVLVVFAIMLTSSTDLLETHPAPHRRILAALASLGFLALTGVVFYTAKFAAAEPGEPPLAETKAIGGKLLDSGAGGYVLPFIIVSILLLAAVLGGVVVARKAPAPHQPFTSGGDLPGEAEFEPPHSQRDRKPGDNR